MLYLLDTNSRNAGFEDHYSSKYFMFQWHHDRYSERLQSVFDWENDKVLPENICLLNRRFHGRLGGMDI
jgi:hypothetical protein